MLTFYDKNSETISNIPNFFDSPAEIILTEDRQSAVINFSFSSGNLLIENNVKLGIAIDYEISGINSNGEISTVKSSIALYKKTSLKND